MNEILKKIEEAAEEFKDKRDSTKDKSYFKYCDATIYGLLVAKEIILSQQKEPLTIGDKIRESNENLAEYIHQHNYDRFTKPLPIRKADILNDLNQPYKE